MLLLVGLGNPGAKYSRHRHNVGFMAVDSIANYFNFSAGKSKFHGEIREGLIDGQKALVLKPATYMNDSGRAVAAAAKFFDVPLDRIVVFHDELDLPPGKIKVKSGGGNAGHNGLKSIDSHIGNDFRRVRIGIGHPGDKSRVSGYVLGDFSKADQDWLLPILDAIASAAPKLKDGDNAFSSAVGALVAPQTKKKSAEQHVSRQKKDASGKTLYKPIEKNSDGVFSDLLKGLNLKSRQNENKD